MPSPKQPFDRVPDPVSTTLHGAWLNKDVLGSGDAASDSGPDGYDMTRVGAPRQEQVGMHFTAASTQFLRNGTVNWRSGDSAGTITAWIKIDALGANMAIWATNDEATAFLYRMTFAVDGSGVGVVRHRNGGATNSVYGDTVLTTDTWYHVALTSSGSAYAMYVNGVPQGLTGTNDGNWIADIGVFRDNVTLGSERATFDTNLFDGTIKDVRYYSAALSADEILLDYLQCVPDDDLRLWDDGTGDLSRYARARTLVGGVIVGNTMSLDGVDDRIDYGDLGNIRQISMWINPGSITEEIVLVDAGNDIMVSGGTVTYAGLTASATYVNGVASTTLVAGLWQHLVCQFTEVDANNFELGTDGANFGDIDVRRLRAHADVWSADEVALVYAREEARV